MLMADGCSLLFAMSPRSERAEMATRRIGCARRPADPPPFTTTAPTFWRAALPVLMHDEPDDQPARILGEGDLRSTP